MKKCFKCGKRKPRSMFYSHPAMADGLLGKCKECTKADVKEKYNKTRMAKSLYEQSRNKTPERRDAKKKYQDAYRKRYPQKWKARQAVAWAVRVGKLKKKPCAVCGNRKAEAHHDDYFKVLDVIWLCFKHHRERHGQVVVVEC